MDKLYFLTGPLQGATAELIGDEITIGRASDNGICIDDKSISDHHAVINRQNKDCILRDLQSAKGTTVRGNKIIVVTLEDSDRITFGSVEAEFTTTEVRLHMPKSTVLPQPSTQPTWPQRRSASAAQGRSSFKSAVLTLVQLAAMGALAYGGYWYYQKLIKVGPNGDTPAVDTARETSSPKPDEYSCTTAAVHCRGHSSARAPSSDSAYSRAGICGSSFRCCGSGCTCLQSLL